MITVWSEQLRVSAHDTDINDNVRPSAMLRYMQEAAVLEFHNTKPSIEQMRRENHKTYLLSRLSMRIYRPLGAYEYITAQSWACPSRHSTFIRCGQVLHGNELVAQLHSTWALVDLDTRSLLLVEDNPVLFGTAPVLDMPTRLRIPRQVPFSEAARRTVTYHDCDVNCHMNNTRYADMLCDYLDMHGHAVSSLMINYNHEAALGETVTVLRGQDEDGTWYFRTQKENGENGIEAAVTLCDL